MAIFDCFQYFNEEHIADLRFNILNESVDFFVIVESTVNHQGKAKKLHFDISKYKKFSKKIKYIVVNDTPENIKKPHTIKITRSINQSFFNAFPTPFKLLPMGEYTMEAHRISLVLLKTPSKISEYSTIY